ncbi:50S ribosomal protein L34e [Candidatus Micrarchaeota archaeon]|nr:50S ribosomal protein L34e [Candidatus Micrarchaeota archaeon]
MPLPRNRSRSKRKIFKRVTSGTKITYVKRKKGKVHRCALCHAILPGTHSNRGLSKTKKRPERLFGGHLCHKCTRKVIRYNTKLNTGLITMDDVDIKFRKYVEMMKK